MKKIFIFLILGMFLLNLGFVNAENIGTFKLNEEFEITNYCNSGDCSYMNLSSITYPNGTVFYINEQMTKTGQEFNYSFKSDLSGTYYFQTCANPEGVFTCEKDNFSLNPNGNLLNIEMSVLYGFVFLLIGMFLFFSIAGMRKTESGGWLIFYICLTYILIYALMGILYLITGDFLWATPIIPNILYIVWFVMGIGFLPFTIVMALYILGKEAKAALEQDYMKQGYSREEARDLTKKRR